MVNGAGQEVELTDAQREVLDQRRSVILPKAELRAEWRLSLRDGLSVNPHAGVKALILPIDDTLASVNVGFSVVLGPRN